MVNYPNYHGSTSRNSWYMTVEPVAQGICMTAYPGDKSLYLLSDHAHNWDYGIAVCRFWEPMANHLCAYGFGSLSEIFDGDAPITPRQRLYCPSLDSGGSTVGMGSDKFPFLIWIENCHQDQAN